MKKRTSTVGLQCSIQNAMLPCDINFAAEIIEREKEKESKSK